MILVARMQKIMKAATSIIALQSMQVLAASYSCIGQAQSLHRLMRIIFTLCFLFSNYLTEAGIYLHTS